MNLFKQIENDIKSKKFSPIYLLMGEEEFYIDYLTNLIAETGGLNCLIADSSALTEHIVEDVINSAFNSAGQRCWRRDLDACGSAPRIRLPRDGPCGR